MQELRALGGITRAVLDDDDLMNMFIPTIRADFSILERGLVSPEVKIACPISMLAARQEVVFEHAALWAERAIGAFRLVEMNGGHFFLPIRRDAVLAEVRDAVARGS